MGYLVAVSGLLMLVMSVAALLAPEKVGDVLLRWPVRRRFFFAFGLRLVLGVIFLLGASDTRFPTFISIIGTITVIAAIVLLLLGQKKVDAFVRWWLRRNPAFMRIWALVGVVLSVLILYAGLGRPPLP
ncbi:MAG TPA: hypothetical protein VNQ90_18480 [Chthoniobacteraceae bacterium]|nr:hypothetical protein [Chthoniobacteraceae bacterium]